MFLKQTTETQHHMKCGQIHVGQYRNLRNQRVQKAQQFEGVGLDDFYVPKGTLTS